MSNVKTSKNNKKLYKDLESFYNTITGKDQLGACLYLALFDEEINKLINEIISSDGDLDDRTIELMKKIVIRLRLVLYSNLNSISAEIDKVNNSKIAYDQTLEILKELGDNDKCEKIKFKISEKIKADFGFGLGFLNDIEELGCFLEKIKKILESLRIAIENADTYEEKLKEFLMNDVFIEILKNGIRSLKMSDLDIDEIYNKII